MVYETVLFDNDGVIAHRSDRAVIYDAIHRTFTEFGVTNPTDSHIQRLFRASLEDIMVVTTAYDLDPAAFWERRDRNVAQAQIELIQQGNKELYDDADVLAALPGQIGVVSNNQHQTVEYLLDHHGVTPHVDVTYGRKPTLTDLRRQKPAPHYLNRALTDLGADPTRTLYVGDSVTDILAARRAGIDAAFLRRSHRQELDLPVAPTFELDSLSEITQLAKPES